MSRSLELAVVMFSEARVSPNVDPAVEKRARDLCQLIAVEVTVSCDHKQRFHKTNVAPLSCVVAIRTVSRSQGSHCAVVICDGTKSNPSHH